MRTLADETASASRTDADDGHLGVARHASPLDLGPVVFRRAPARLRRREPERLVRGVEAQQDHPPRHALGRVAPDEGRGDDLGRKQRLVEGIGDLEAAGRLARERQRRRLASAGGRGEQRGEREPGYGRPRAVASARSSSMSRMHRFGTRPRPGDCGRSDEAKSIEVPRGGRHAAVTDLGASKLTGGGHRRRRDGGECQGQAVPWRSEHERALPLRVARNRRTHDRYRRRRDGPSRLSGRVHPGGDRRRLSGRHDPRASPGRIRKPATRSSASASPPTTCA